MSGSDDVMNIECPEGLSFISDENGLALTDGTLTMRGDFTRMIPRLRKGNLQNEFLVKAAKIKNSVVNENSERFILLDATAGMGEDSLILAAAGFDVKMYEYDPVVAALLRDTLERSAKIPELADVVERMELHEEDSIKAMQNLQDFHPDVILLDPMFPERTKSALVKKKFQLIHRVERPCANEEELLDAAIAVRPKKIVIKRPVKGQFLAGKKPSYSIKGKAVRYDCIVL